MAAEQARYQRYLRPVVADDLQVAALLKEIQGMAEESRVKVIEIKPKGIETDPTVKRYTIDVRFDSLLNEWIDFVFRIETSPSLCEVVRATLVVPEDHPDRLAGTFRIVSAVVNTKGLSSGNDPSAAMAK